MPSPAPIDDPVAPAAPPARPCISGPRWAGLAGGVLVAVWVAALVRFRGWNANDDLAILQLHLERLGEGHIPLVGAYSRLDFHHPGPLREWVFGIAYWLSGRRSASLPATALTLNLAWTAAACVMGWRIARRSGLVAAALGGLLLHLGLGWNLHSAWNPYLATLAAYAAVWGVVAVVAHGPDSWPVPVVAGSFAAQLHVSLLAVGLGAALVAVVAVGRPRPRRVGSRLATAAGATVLLWAGPLLDLLRWNDANVVSLVRNGGTGDPVGPVAAGRHVGHLLMPWSIARGDALMAVGSETPASPFAVIVLVVGVVVFALALARLRPVLGRSARVALGVALAVVLLVWGTVAAGFTSPLFPYLFAPSVGALALVGAAGALVLAGPVRWAVGGSSPRLGRAAAGVALVAVAIAWIDGGWSTMQPIATAPLQREIDAAVGAAVVSGQTYTIQAAGLVESVAYGEVALAVQQAGGEPRSDIFALGLAPATPDDPVVIAAMGEPLACLLRAEAVPEPVVLGPSRATGLDVGVFLAHDPGGREAVESCRGAEPV